MKYISESIISTSLAQNKRQTKNGCSILLAANLCKKLKWMGLD